MKFRSCVFLLTMTAFVSAVFPFHTDAGIQENAYRSATPLQEITIFDQRISIFMQKWQIPGGSVAVSKDGRLVFAKGYGLADKETSESVQPDSLFRIASISKPVTSAAVLRLVEEGKLSLDDKAFLLLDHLQPPQGAKVDKRIYNITIRQLLQHTGGWDIISSFDPMFISNIAASSLGAPAPASSETVIRYMLGQPLQFAPGTAFSYSNFGYNLLGRIIEKVSGQSYESYVKENVFAPAGIICMQVGHSLLKDRAQKEVRYYDAPGSPPINSVFPEVPGPVPAPYGGWHHQSLDSTGGWIGSAIDVVRFVNVIDGFDSRPDILRSSTVDLMVSRPVPPLSGGGQTYYAMGWGVVILNGGLDWQHTGAINGSSGFVIRTRNGVVVAALFNSWGRLRQDALLNELGVALYESINAVQQWPAQDLFASFAECEEIRGDFNLAVTQASKVIAPGDATEIVIDALGFNNFNQTVNLSATLSPPDSNVDLNFSSMSIAPGTREILTVRAAEGAPVTELSITITGTASEITHTANADVVIAPGPWIQSATFDGKKNLVIDGGRFGNQARVIINGIDRSKMIKKTSQTRINVKGKAKKLGLVAGDNTVEVIDSAGTKSNVTTVRF